MWWIRVALLFYFCVSCYGDLADKINQALSEEMKNIVPAVAEKFNSQLNEIKSEMQLNFAGILSSLNASHPKIDIPYNFDNDSYAMPNDFGESPPIEIDLSSESIQALSTKIVDALRDEIDVIIENKIENKQKDIINAISALNSTYSKLYRKLFQYTRRKVNLLSDKIVSNTEFEQEETTTILPYTNPKNCGDAKLLDYTTGPTDIEIQGEIMTVWCDQDTDGGGWMVFLRREPQATPLAFRRDYDEYRQFFGELNGEHWLGLETIHRATQEKPMSLRVDIHRHDESAFGKWDYFKVDDASSYYTLKVEGFDPDSTAGDAMEYHSGMKFSTRDRDNDKASGGSCSAWSGGGGWWYNYCYFSNPTGEYPHSNLKEGDEADHYLEWRKWQGYYVYLTDLTMMIRPLDFPQ